MTEALSHCFTNPLYGEQRMGTIGQPDGIQADIVDGQLYIKGPSVFTDQWYNTGDLADCDQQGYYKILGRSRDQINIKGIKLNPVSLENQLQEGISGVEDCVIFGTSSIKCLYIGNSSSIDIKKFLIGLGSYCYPTMIKKVETIPLSPSGKISRSWLDQQF
jgi:acyl-coenzyme A synthetase/AMP-(fatty) acid ligase